MTIKVKVYNGSKYDESSKKVAEVIYKNIKAVEVNTICDNDVFEMGFDEVDENAEYATITFENGETSTFRNTCVDVFEI